MSDIIAKAGESKKKTGMVDRWPGWKKQNITAAIICWKCKKEVSDYEFKLVDQELKPVCSVCTGRKEVMDAISSVEVERFEKNLMGDVTLEKWIK